MSNDINYREYQMKKMQYQIKRTKLALIMMFIAAICFAICAYGSICVMRKYKSYSEELEKKVSEMQDELNSAKTNEAAMETAYMSLKYEMESQEETPIEEVSEETEPTQEEVEEIISTYVSSDPYTPTKLTADQFNSIITSSNRKRIWNFFIISFLGFNVYYFFPSSFINMRNFFYSIMMNSSSSWEC